MNSLVNYFKNLFSHCEPSEELNCSTDSENDVDLHIEELDRAFSQEEIVRTIQSMKTGKKWRYRFINS